MPRWQYSAVMVVPVIMLNNSGLLHQRAGFLYDLCISIFICTIILLKSVAVRKLQVAILARSSREMYQTVRID